MYNEYKYQCRDESILLNPFKKVVVAPLMKFMPYKIPANTITIISNLFLYYALYLSFIHNGSPTNFLIISALIFSYVVGDHFDGMQARRTGTGSPLGEFCDHYLDIYNNGILLIIIFNLFNVTNSYVVTSAFFMSYICHSAIIFEQLKTKWLIFEKIGSLEGLFITLSILISSYFKPVRELFSTKLLLDLSIIEIVLLVTLILGLSTLVRVSIRVGKFSKKFITYVFLLGFISIYSIRYLSFNYLVILLTLYNSIYIGNLMKAHLIDSKERFSDFVVPLLILIDIIFFNGGATNFYFIAILYMIIYLAFITVTVGYPLREFWFWVNPSNKEV